MNVSYVLDMNGTDDFFIFETDHWSVQLNPNQKYVGRSVVNLKRSCGNLAELTNEEVLEFLQVVKKVQKLLQSTLGATMFNWSCLMNNAYQTASPNPQVHWHCVPRYKSSTIFDGKVFSDPNFGHRMIADIERLERDVEQKLVAQLRTNASQIT